MPWRLLNAIFGRRVARELRPAPESWPLPSRRILEGIPIVSSGLLPAVRRDDVIVKPAIDRLNRNSVRFVDGSEERVDEIVYATGYRISLPYLSWSLVSTDDPNFPLYRRIVPPKVRGLDFAGFVDAPGGLLPVVETQGQWIAAVLSGRLRLPGPERMWRAIERVDDRTRERFPHESPAQHPLRPAQLPTAAACRPAASTAGDASRDRRAFSSRSPELAGLFGMTRRDGGT
jgi:Flavin-binding monooxygenase-like